MEIIQEVDSRYPSGRISSDREDLIDIVTSPHYKEPFPSFEGVPLSQGVHQPHMSNEKIGLIKETPFEKYCQENFRNHTSWGIKLALTEVMSFSHSKINTSLTRLPKKLNKKAKSTFRSILIYMKEKSSSKGSSYYINKLIRIGMNASEDLCDEIYCQLVKQTNNNSKITSCIRAWKLFCICSGLFPPSHNLRLSLLNHLVKVLENEDQEITQRACYCATKIEKVLENGKRLEMPSKAEIKYAKHMKPQPILVHFLSGSCLCMYVESNDNASDLKRSILKRIGISVPFFPYFGLFEFCENSGLYERYIEENELIMDIVSTWKDPDTYKIVLKLRIILKSFRDSIISNFLYIQKSYEIAAGIIPLSLRDALYLGGLKLSVDKEAGQKVEFLVDAKLHMYIQERLFNYMPRQEWIRRLLSNYFSSIIATKAEAKRLYLEHISDQMYFGCSFFVVSNQDGLHSIPKESYLCVDSEGLMIVEMTFAKIYLKVTYKEISKWAFSKEHTGFVLVRGGNQTMYLFHTLHARTIEQLIMDYVNKMLGRPITRVPSTDMSLRVLGLSKTLMTKISLINTFTN